MHRVESFAFWLIISGAIGNLFDRFAFGYVRDFIDYEFISAIIGRQLAICNFADLVLIVGTVMLIVYVVFFYGKEHPSESTAPTEPVSSASETDGVRVVEQSSATAVESTVESDPSVVESTIESESSVVESTIESEPSLVESDIGSEDVVTDGASEN